MLRIAVTTRFLIWTTQRTGSTVFWRTLDRHPEIEGHGESEQTTYIVRVKDDSREALLKVSVKSQKAGLDSKEIRVK